MASGLKALALLYEAETERMTAKHLRARAGMYSTEYDWVQKMYDSAEKAEKKAEHLESMVKDD